LIVVCIYTHSSSCVAATAATATAIVVAVIVAAAVAAVAVVAAAEWTSWLNLVKALPCWPLAQGGRKVYFREMFLSYL
jgi:hypothetical protein